MRWNDPPAFISLDIESTGTDPLSDRIVEIGLSVFAEGRCAHTLARRVNPGIPIPGQATAVHGITDRDVADLPPLRDQMPWLLARIAPDPGDLVPLLVGYNAAAFDVPLLVAEMARCGYLGWEPRLLDVYHFVGWVHRDWHRRKLVDATRRYAVPHAGAHSAGADARACGELLLRLVEAGHVPPSREAALVQGAAYGEALAAEWHRYGGWLYEDRLDPRVLRLGKGPPHQQGRCLGDLDGGLLRSLLRDPELPGVVREALRAEVAQREPLRAVGAL